MRNVFEFLAGVLFGVGVYILIAGSAIALFLLVFAGGFGFMESL